MPQIDWVDLSNPAATVPIDEQIHFSGARNEWVSFVLRLRNLPANDGKHSERLKIDRFFWPGETADSATQANQWKVYQIVPMPVDTNRAGYLRHTGLPVKVLQLPRALLPLSITKENTLDLTKLRDPAHPYEPTSRIPTPDQAVLIWVDYHIQKEMPAGDFDSTVILTSDHTLARKPISLHVHDFSLPDDRGLQMVGKVSWESLQRLYPDRFGYISPRLVNRKEDAYAPIVSALDGLTKLAESHRLQTVFTRLQPTVKWPSGSGPQVDWSDYDSLVTPWLSGSMFADKTPPAFWPIAQIDRLQYYDSPDRKAYWTAAAAHFGEHDWLSRSAVILRANSPRDQLLAEARLILDADPLLRVMLPISADELSFRDDKNPQLPDSAGASRIMPRAGGLVFPAPKPETWSQLQTAQPWLMTDDPGLVPYIGAGGDEHDVRLWAWLAFVKHATTIVWDDPLPRRGRDELADPGEMVWFYPGQWFGVDEPVPSIQLKWLRRAEQDYEYLNLAAERGMAANAYLLARLMTKQVVIQPGQSPDPEYALLTGTVDQNTWTAAQNLLARTILLRTPGQDPADPELKSKEVALNLDTIRWQQPKERPFILPRAAEWTWDSSLHAEGDRWAKLRLGIDIYNAGDNRPTDNLLQWSFAGAGWEIDPQPTVIGALQTYWVQRFELEASLNLSAISASTRVPMQISFTDGYTRVQYRSQVMLPAATSDRRDAHPTIDGKLDEWDEADQIQNGPLTQMLNRPSVQHWKIEPATTDSQIYTTWADDHFYIAFRVHGLDARPAAQRNFIEEQFRRAWGEDLCQAMIQPIYDDGTSGPATYLACKPNGVCVVRHRDTGGNWRESDGSAVQYAAESAGDEWTGEIAIPWPVLIDQHGSPPRLLRFNFIQHRSANGESASWAGPIDFDRDESLLGLLYLRDSSQPK